MGVLHILPSRIRNDERTVVFHTHGQLVDVETDIVLTASEVVMNTPEFDKIEKKMGMSIVNECR